MQIKRVLMAGVAGAAMLVAMAGTADAASAAKPKAWPCTNGYVCLYSGAKGKPALYKTNDCGLTAIPSTFASKAKSARNRTGSPVYLFSGATSPYDNFETLDDGEQSSFDPGDYDSAVAIFVACD
jgi:hypothetical protein